MVLFMPFLFSSWILLYYAPTSWVIILARLLLGIFVGVMADPSVTYVTEISQEHIRGRLVSIIDFNRVVGICFVFLIGNLGLKWRELALITGLVTCIPPIIGLLFLPNSFRWLISKDRHNEAVNALKFFRNKTDDEINTEIKLIIEGNKESSDTLVKQMKSLLKLTNIKRLVAISILCFCTQFSGLLLVVNYSTLIMKSVFVEFNEYSSSLILGAVRFFALIIFIAIVDNYQRKTIYFFSFLSAGICMIFMGVIYTLETYNMVISSYIPFVVLMIFELAISMSDSSVTVFRTELLPGSIRAIGMSITMVIFCVAGFLALQTFPLIINSSLKIHGAFFIYSAFCIFMSIIVKYALPETNGKVLEEIK